MHITQWALTSAAARLYDLKQMAQGQERDHHDLDGGDDDADVRDDA